MCIFGSPKLPSAAPQLIPSVNNNQARQQAEIEAALRRRRAGAAADVLTSPTGIPSTAKLGGVAR